MSSLAKFNVTNGNPEDITLQLSDALPTEGDLLFAMQRERSRILQRTAQGVDADGRSFESYSPGYAKRKAKSGRNSSPVDLTYSGKMLQSIQAQADTLRFGPGEDAQIGLKDYNHSASEARLGIYNNAEAARAQAINNGEGAMPRRNFFATADDDVPKIAGDIEARVIRRNKDKFGK